DYAGLERQAADHLTAAGWLVDYVEIRRADTLEMARAGDKKLVVLAAARLGTTRLIDNVEVGLP
ncbi:TPA: pantoate--beta-alanine ligase, partial [Neisseria gonorrhoeae]